jgi:phage gp16-like protein
MTGFIRQLALYLASVGGVFAANRRFVFRQMMPTSSWTSPAPKAQGEVVEAHVVSASKA